MQRQTSRFTELKIMTGGETDRQAKRQQDEGQTEEEKIVAAKVGHLKAADLKAEDVSQMEKTKRRVRNG